MPAETGSLNFCPPELLRGYFLQLFKKSNGLHVGLSAGGRYQRDSIKPLSDMTSPSGSSHMWLLSAQDPSNTAFGMVETGLFLL